MGVELTTRKYYRTEKEILPQTPGIHPLAQETGWKEVAAGLGRILAGYFAVVVTVAGAMIMSAIIAVKGRTGRTASGEPDAAYVWLVSLTVVGIGFLGLLSYKLMLGGKLRCAKSAPERWGARWYIFGCMACLAAGPLLSVFDSFFGARPPAHYEDTKSLGGMLLHASSLPQLLGAGTSLAGSVLFVLFLRSVGVCFQARRLTDQCQWYLALAALLLAFTLFLVFGADPRAVGTKILIAVGLGWLALGIGYVYLILAARRVIKTRVAWYSKDSRLA